MGICQVNACKLMRYVHCLNSRADDDDENSSLIFVSLMFGFGCVA
jgi:hypothetical protein